MTPINQFTFKLLGILLLVANVSCNKSNKWLQLEEEIDYDAVEHCKRLHGGEIDQSLSKYKNLFCKLDCYVEGYLFQYYLNEGLRCPGANSKLDKCYKGDCVHREVYKGHFEVKIVSASLPIRINAYATACLINSTNTVHLPMRDRSVCVGDCLTGLDNSTENPVWNFACKSFYPKIVTAESTLVLEIWNNLGDMENHYEGGVVLRLPEMDNDNTKEWDFDTNLTEGKINGTIKTHIRWTKI